MGNPRFSDSRGMTFNLASKPPFYFEGMTTRVFPLRASLYQLQRFCDSFLNVVPASVGRFRPFMPYVMLMIMDYGKMAAAATNEGWVAQREIMFSVPLEWYRVVDGRWEFHDWAFCSPFIYVDDELSMTLGRTVYGWPKSLAWLDAGLNEWIEDPRAIPRAAAMSTMVFPEVYAGKRQQPRVFLEIHEAPPVSPFDFPPDAESAFAPWMMLARASTGAFGVLGDVGRVLSGMGFTRWHPGADPQNYLAMARRAMEMSNPYDPRLAFNTVNLKQFRRSERPDQFCYQALTNAQMRLTNFNRGGLMGDVHMLAGDVSGGYAIDLHRWDSLPIVDTLGLEVAHEWQGDGARVARLRPVFPFWYEVDMDYDLGRTDAWRTIDLDWRDAEGRVIARHEPGDPGTYSTALGASGQAVAGPFRFPSTTVRVLPLLARREALARYLDGYLNEPLRSKGVRFSVWAPEGEGSGGLAYVYVMAMSYGEMSSETNNIGWWAERELTACIPVKVERRNAEGEWELETLGLVPTFSYADSTTATIARSEVVGIPTIKADIHSPPNVWMSDEGPAAERLQPLLELSSEVLPVMGEGQQTQQQVILDVQEGEVLPTGDDRRWAAIGEDWGTLLKGELERKKRAAKDWKAYPDALALALEVLGDRAPVSFFTMKQSRDIAAPDLACYQSVVAVERTIEEVYDLREIEGPFHLRIHEYPSQPFVEQLGLVTKIVREDAGEVVHCLQPIRPFWMKVSLKEELGKRLWWRAGDEVWRGEGLPQPYFRDPPRAAPGSGPRVGRSAIWHFMTGEPVRLRTALRAWREFYGASLDEVSMSLAEARAAVKAIDPQVIIETILSWEWENASPRARWRRARADLTRSLDSQFLGVTPDEATQGEITLFRRKLSDMQRDFPEDMLTGVEETLDRLAFLFKARRALDERFDGLAMAEDADAFWQNAATFVGHLHELATASPDDVLRGIAENFDLAPWEANPPAWEKAAAWEAFRRGDPSSPLRQLIRDARDMHHVSREGVIMALAKAAQKPCFCVPRNCVGPEADRVFPRLAYGTKTTFEDVWYVGPPYRVTAPAEAAGADPPASAPPARR